MYIRSIRKSERINRRCGVFGHTERPQNECSIYEHRPICNVHSGTNSGRGNVKDVYVPAQIDNALPTTEAECAKMQVISQVSLRSKPALGIKPLRLRKYLWVVGNRPENNVTPTQATPLWTYQWFPMTVAPLGIKQLFHTRSVVAQCANPRACVRCSTHGVWESERTSDSHGSPSHAL